MISVCAAEGWRVWAGLVYPGAALPNAMVQLSPITEFGSGAGYEYEDTVIYAFTHTNKGHWNVCHIPFLPVCGEVSARAFGSRFSHAYESARPGYYQVLLERYAINAELTTTLRCGYHKYTYADNRDKKLIVNLAVSHERVGTGRSSRMETMRLKAAREPVSMYIFMRCRFTKY
jgi:putative alpha-1,2-mannosidase